MKLKQSIVVLPTPMKKSVIVKTTDGSVHRFENADVECFENFISIIYSKSPKGLKRTNFPMHSVSHFTIEEANDD